MWLFVFIVQIAIAVLVVYLFAYVKKRADNAAVLKDLEKITGIVEGIKKKNEDDSRIIQARIDMITNKNNVLFAEEKLAIHDFFIEINKWLLVSLDFRMFLNYKYNEEMLLKKKEEAVVSSKNVVVSFSTLQLFVKDENLLSSAHDFYLKVKDVHVFTEMNLMEIITMVEERKHLTCEKTEQLLKTKIDDFVISVLAERKGYYTIANEARLIFVQNASVYLNSGTATCI